MGASFTTPIAPHSAPATAAHPSSIGTVSRLEAREEPATIAPGGEPHEDAQPGRLAGATTVTARREIGDFIEQVHHRQQLHSAGYRPPAAFEANLPRYGAAAQLHTA